MKNQIKRNKKNKQRNNGYRLGSMPSYSNFEKQGLTFMDPHKYITFKYSDVISQSLATVTATNQIFNMNSIFDPDRTGTGHQPYGHDTLAEVYNRYRVWAFSWKITFHAESQGFDIVTIPTNGNLASAISNQASFSAACEVPRSRVYSQGTGANAVVASGFIKLNDLNGTSPQEYRADDRFQALFSASPGELLLLNVGTYNPSGTTVAVDFIVELEYYTEIYDPIIVAQS